MSLNFDEVNILGNLINDTFGKPSMSGGYGIANSVVTKSSLSGEILTVTSLAVINLANLHTQHQEIAKCENELNQHWKAYIKDLKKNFKKKEHAGRALKTKEDQNKRTTDVQDLNVYAETRKAYVYRRAYFEVS